MVRGRQVRVAGATLTIPAAKVPRLEAIEARDYASDAEREAAVQAAADYLADVPDPPAPVRADIGSAEDARAAAAEIARLADERTAVILRGIEANGRQLQAGRAQLDRYLAAARAVAVLAVEDGVSEAAAARALGVDRLTLRKWLGKRDRK